MMPLPTDPSKLREFVSREHREYKANVRRWQWLLDSLEGGHVYRDAVYGYDRQGFPIRNLVRHKRENPDPKDIVVNTSALYGAASAMANSLTGSGDTEDPAYYAMDNDYELRRARTPVPSFVKKALEGHMAEIFSKEIARAGPTELETWWEDVDGEGTSMDCWFADHVAPYLLVLGQLDVLVDRPPAPDPSAIRTRRDEIDNGLDRAVARVILPSNMMWWQLDADGCEYTECLVREYTEDEFGVPVPRFRYWDGTRSVLLDESGQSVGSPVPHPYGRVPIVRVFDHKRKRSRNVGNSRYEGVSQRQREYYNRDSELILSDSTQVHPVLQGPEDYFQEDATVPIGPGNMLPMKKNTSGTSTTYEGFSVVQFPKEGADSLRQNKADIHDQILEETYQDRSTTAGGPTSKGTIEQSGISKSLDMKSAHANLADIAKRLAAAEARIAALALDVLRPSPGPRRDSDAIEVIYPTSFDLYSVSDLSVAVDNLQKLVAASGNLPEVEGELLKRLMRLSLPGRSDSDYRKLDATIDSFLAKGGGIAAKAEQATQALEAQAKFSPAGNVQGKVHDPTSRLQPPGQTGQKKVTGPKKPDKNPQGNK